MACTGCTGRGGCCEIEVRKASRERAPGTPAPPARARYAAHITRRAPSDTPPHPTPHPPPPLPKVFKIVDGEGDEVDACLMYEVVEVGTGAKASKGKGKKGWLGGGVAGWRCGGDKPEPTPPMGPPPPVTSSRVSP